MFYEEQIYYVLKNHIWNLELDNADIIFKNIKFVAVEDLKRIEDGRNNYIVYGDISEDINYNFSYFDSLRHSSKVGHLISLDQRYLLRCSFFYIDISEKSCILKFIFIQGVEYDIGDKIKEEIEDKTMTFLDLLDFD